jgi:TnpA family transposase
MPRRHALTTAQLDELFALPTELNTLVRYWTLAGTDLEAIHRRRHARNRLGFALQLCALRYPGAASGAGRIDPGGSTSLRRPPG